MMVLYVRFAVGILVLVCGMVPTKVGGVPAAHVVPLANTNRSIGSCAIDWAQCGGKTYDGPTNCCNTQQYCHEQDEFYSECIPKPIKPFPFAPASSWCGEHGTKSNPAAFGSTVSALDIATIWKFASEGLVEGHAPGGHTTCVAAVTVALGECGHPAQSPWRSIYDPVCSKDASGAGGLWQVTSQDIHDTTLAGCDDGFDYCCNARIAYAHAYLEGGATMVPSNYCEETGCADNDCCGLLKTPISGTAWNDPKVDKSRKPNARIPECSTQTNVWYAGSDFKLSSVTADQEPCWFGPFSIAAGGVGRPFFPGFYGWGGFLQHYTDSKAGECDRSPQGNAASCDEGKYQGLPTYAELAELACNEPTPAPPAPSPPGPPAPPPGPTKCVSISPGATDAWCQANCHNEPPFCPSDLCKCTPTM
eukprot:m.141062 g.141062  ORF g.141062 m.141062 type:complete len:419 (-) comp30160_c7_seq1:353-1609(-)